MHNNESNFVEGPFQVRKDITLGDYGGYYL